MLFGGRLGQYRYYDMDKVIAAALQMVSDEAEADITIQNAEIENVSAVAVEHHPAISTGHIG